MYIYVFQSNITKESSLLFVLHLDYTELTMTSVKQVLLEMSSTTVVRCCRYLFMIFFLLFVVCCFSVASDADVQHSLPLITPLSKPAVSRYHAHHYTGKTGPQGTHPLIMSVFVL